MCCPSQASRVEHLTASVISWRLVPFLPSGRQGAGTLDEGDGAKAEARPGGSRGQARSGRGVDGDRRERRRDARGGWGQAGNAGAARAGQLGAGGERGRGSRGAAGGRRGTQARLVWEGRRARETAGSRRERRCDSCGRALVRKRRSHRLPGAFLSCPLEARCCFARSEGCSS